MVNDEEAERKEKLDIIVTELALRSQSRRESYFPPVPPRLSPSPRSPHRPSLSSVGSNSRRSFSKLIPVTEEGHQQPPLKLLGNSLHPEPGRRSSCLSFDASRRLSPRLGRLRRGVSSNTLIQDRCSHSHVISELSCNTFKTLISEDSRDSLV